MVGQSDHVHVIHAPAEQRCQGTVGLRGAARHHVVSRRHFSVETLSSQSLVPAQEDDASNTRVCVLHVCRGTGRWVRGECSQFLNTSYLNDLLNTLSSPPLKKNSITCDNLKRRTGFARTLDSLSDGLDGVGLSTLQHLQDTAAVGGAAGRPLSLGGAGVDCDAQGILVFNPGDRSIVGVTVQGVVNYLWSTGGWAGDCDTLLICLLRGSFC